MKIVYRITEQDFTDAQALFVANERPLYRRYSRRIMPWLGVFIILLQAVVLVLAPEENTALAAMGLLLGAYLVFCGFAIRRYFKRLYQKDHRYKHDFTAEISEKGIDLTTPFSDSQMKWTTFVRFLELDRIFLVFVAEWNFLIFPKRVCTRRRGRFPGSPSEEHLKARVKNCE